MATRNRRLLLRERPSAEVGSEHFELVETDVPIPGEGEVLLRARWLSFDPAQRGYLNDVRSYAPPVAIGDVMRADGIGEVVASHVPGIEVGRLVHASIGWQDYCVLSPGLGEPVEMVPLDLAQPELMLSVLGTTGLTAFFGMTEVGRPIEGDTVLVTAAAGATGSIAGQIARILGAERVLGTAGAESKRAWVRDVAGFDDCLDHYDEKLRRHIASAAPEGIDVVFDNVGGSVLDACLFNIAERARLVLCGSISTGYRPERPKVGLHFYQLLTSRRSRMEGFIVTDFTDRFSSARAILQDWVSDGRIRQEHDILTEFERAPEALNRLFSGGNVGKQLLRIDD